LRPKLMRLAPFNILDRYIAREVLGPFALGVLLLTLHWSPAGC